ncbi:hypothetical protein E2C01_046281 [Portunus trituberculatus]|uniref:Uncharacterized protein n=1 Tax=Portunus trituberculatus TaxID=210409 RepID=A0A5B7G0J1_PORTR|nr:hypothetical protein [Portunus trituberculatus]
MNMKTRPGPPHVIYNLSAVLACMSSSPCSLLYSSSPACTLSRALTFSVSSAHTLSFHLRHLLSPRLCLT